MLNTINNIVDISKIESGLMKVDIKETNINEKIEFIYKFFKPEVEIKGLQFLFKNSLPAKEAIIKTDNENVYGVLTNLVRNAIKFTYEGSIEFGYEKKGGSLKLCVKDAVFEEKTEKANAVSIEKEEVQIKNLKILIVEDDEISYSLLTRMLQKISKEVLPAITGVQAVEACRNNPDIDLVLMDIRMPEMNGNEATRQIRQFNKDVIIIAQTAYAFAGESEKAIAAGCNDYISKPINKTFLYELINKHCNK